MRAPSAIDALPMLQRSRWFMRQPQALRLALIDHGRVLTLAKGQWLFAEGDEQSGLYTVLSGAMRLEVTVGPERDLLLDIVRPGTIAGQTARFGGGPRLVTARAAEPSVVLLISDAVLQVVGEAHPALWRAVSELIYGQLDRSVRMAAEALSLPPRARLAARLLALSRDHAPEGDVVRISQADLAEMSGLSRKSANGHLQALQDLGLVRPVYRGVHILDRGRLRALVDHP